MKTITFEVPDAIAHSYESNTTLMAYISQNMLRGYAAEVRFRERIAQGSRKKGLAVLDKLDKCYGE